MLAANEAKPRLHLSLRRAAGLLTLTYTVTNNSATKIYLFNKLYRNVDPSGKFVIDPNICTVQVVNDIIYIGKKIFPVPPLRSVEILNIPCVSEVPGGQELTEQVSLRIPLRQWNPYMEEEPKPTVTKSLPLAFEVGYFFDASGTKALADIVPTTAGECARFDPFPISSQLILTAGPMAARAEIQL